MKKAIVVTIAILIAFTMVVSAASTIIPMSDGDIAELLCEDRAISLQSDRVVVTCNDALIDTPTPLPPSATPTNTAVFLPTVTNTAAPTATPSGATGIGIIGDSASYPYEYIGRGGPDSFSWVEMVYQLRGADFGPYLAGNSYNRAYSGNTTANIDGQVSGLGGYIQSGLIRLVIIYIGANDLAPMCNTAYTPTQAQSLYNAMTANMENGVIDLITYGMSAGDLYMVTQADRSDSQPCSNAAQLSTVVDALNAEFATMAGQYGFNLIDFNQATTAVIPYIDGSGNINIDGETVTFTACDLPTCFLVADGHPNTVANGIMFNALFADVLGYTPLTDNEIAVMAGLK